MKHILFGLLIFINIGIFIPSNTYAGDNYENAYVDKYDAKYYDKHDAPYDKYSRGYDGLPFVNTEKSGLLKRDSMGRVTDEPYVLPGSKL